MIGYDLDDTLAKVDYAQAGTRGLATVFAQADVIHKPTQDFIVITARAHSSSATKTATEKWLRENNPDHYKGIYYVSGSEDQIVKGKARIIEDRNLTSFTDNNRAILRQLKELLPSAITLYYMRANGTKTEY